MNFEQFAAKVRKLVTDCNIQDAQDKELIIRNFIVTGANSQTAYRKCVEAGPDATLQKVLEIYRNEMAVLAHFQTRHNSQSMVHQINAQYHPLGEEERKMSTNYTTHRREGTIKMPKLQHQRKEAESALAEHVIGVEIAIS